MRGGVLLDWYRDAILFQSRLAQNFLSSAPFLRKMVLPLSEITLYGHRHCFLAVLAIFGDSEMSRKSKSTLKYGSCSENAARALRRTRYASVVYWFSTQMYSILAFELFCIWLNINQKF